MPLTFACLYRAVLTGILINQSTLFQDVLSINGYSVVFFVHALVCFCSPYGKSIPYQDYWNFYEDLMLSVGGRPHWAKVSKLEEFQRQFWQLPVGSFSLKYIV